MGSLVTMNLAVKLTIDLDEYMVPSDGNYQHDIMDSVEDLLSQINGVEVERVSHFTGEYYDE